MPGRPRNRDLDRLLVEAGDAAPRLQALLTEVAQSLLESRLIVRSDVWRRVGSKDAFAKAYLSALFDAPSAGWDDARLFGTPALPAMRAVNRRAHAYGATTGGAQYAVLVADAQGGRFCSMCGRREDLVVDHILPVSVGGSDDALPNMQLLCSECNLGKNNLRDRLLPAVLRHRLTPDISPGLRFKHLLMDSVKVDGRDRGVCACGARADAAELRISIWPVEAAANFLNLRTHCTICQLEG
jgi:5-methylcytosine-specific restriction endonuclease McrA